MLMRSWVGFIGAVSLAGALSGCAQEGDGAGATKTVTETAPATSDAVEPEVETSTASDTPPAEDVAESDEEISAEDDSTTQDDPDRPDDAMSVGDTGTVDDLDVTVEKFQEVDVVDPLDDWSYYGAQVKIHNVGDGPGEVAPVAQMRLENIYVATVEPASDDLVEGEQLLLDTLRPGASATGWVVWAVPDSTELLDSFGIYFESMDASEELVWWHNIT